MTNEHETSSAATRARLLTAAIREFADKGFLKATVRHICQRAGANVNAVKYYFEDKQGLYVAAVSEAHRLGCIDRPEPADFLGLSAEEQLRLFITGMVSMMTRAKQSDEPEHLLMLRELANPTAATAEIVQQFIKPRFQRLNEILAVLLPRDVRTIDRHLLAFSVIGECMHYRIAGPIVQLLVSPSEHQRLTVPRIAEHITQVILAAVEQHHKK